MIKIAQSTYAPRYSLNLALLLSFGTPALAAIGTIAFPIIAERSPFLLFFVAVAVSSWYAGFLFGFVALTLSVLSVAYFIFEPIGSFESAAENRFLTISFALASLIMALAFELRRRAEFRRARESETLHITLQSIGDAVIVVDRENKVRFLNPVAEQLTGWKLSEAEGRDLGEVFPISNEKTGEAISDPLGRVLREGTILGLGNHTVLLNKSAQKIAIDDSAAAIEDPTGKVIGAVLIFRDVTERRKVDVAIRRLASIVENSDDVIIGKDLEGIITNWNKGAEKVYGYTAEETVGQPVHMLAPPEQINEIANIMEKIRRGESVEHLQTVRRRKDGRRIHVSLSVSPIKDEDGEIIGASTIARDITTLKELEQERMESLSREQEARRVAEKAAANMKFMAEASRTFTATLNYEETLRTITWTAVPQIADWSIVLLMEENRNLKQVIVAHSATEKVKQMEDFLRHDGKKPGLSSSFFELIRSSSTMLFEKITDENLSQITQDPEHLRLLKEWKLQSAIVVPLIARHKVLGALTFMTAESSRSYTTKDLPFFEDLAGRAALAIDNAWLFAENERANRVKDEFLATLSHELRTPLTAILGWSRILGSAELDRSTMRKAIDAIQRNAASQVQLINDLLDISKIVTGKMSIERGPTNLLSIVDSAMSIIAPMAESKGLQVRLVSSPKGIVTVNADIERLQQVFWNILTNAVKFSNKGTLVEVFVEVEKDKAVVRFEDHGRGIDPTFLPHVFDKFRQYDSSSTRKFGGLGLGLSIVKQIVELHGGSVTVFSEGVGKGTTVAVTLPILSVIEKMEPSEPSVQPPNQPQNLSVMVVEDDKDTQDLLALWLSGSGMRVVVASSVKEAMKLLESEQIDVLVSDIAMPGSDGYELIRQVQALETAKGKKIPAIAVTAYARGQERDQIIRSGYQIHLSKPVEPTELLKAIELVKAKPQTS